MTLRFGIGSLVAFGNENWEVVYYHRVGKHWEVMFRSKLDNSHRSVDCQQLERYVDG